MFYLISEFWYFYNFRSSKTPKKTETKRKNASTPSPPKKVVRSRRETKQKKAATPSPPKRVTRSRR